MPDVFTSDECSVKRNVRDPIKAAFCDVRTWIDLWSLLLSRTAPAQEQGWAVSYQAFNTPRTGLNAVEVGVGGHHAGVLWICCCSSLMSNRRLNTNISFGRLRVIDAIIIRREVGEAEELF
jgi:hypothetical protein